MEIMTFEGLRDALLSCQDRISDLEIALGVERDGEMASDIVDAIAFVTKHISDHANNCFLTRGDITDLKELAYTIKNIPDDNVKRMSLVNSLWIDMKALENRLGSIKGEFTPVIGDQYAFWNEGANGFYVDTLATIKRSGNNYGVLTVADSYWYWSHVAELPNEVMPSNVEELKRVSRWR